MDIYELAGALFGRSRAENASVNLLRDTTIYGTAEKSADGLVRVYLGDDVTQAEDDGLEHDAYVELPTEVTVMDGDEVAVTLSGGSMSNARVTGVVGGGDRMQAQVDSAEALAQQAEDVAQEAAEEVEQVRQDVADFRDDVATTYATKVEREDGDDAVKTWVTTNYTNSNDLATTYATKTLVSQTKDAIELAASQTYETQSDAAATYATNAALTVGLDGIRSEVAEDYQPKGDYATTASMNSAIQQSASSIESSVAATYETQTDAAATYATKTEVQQTASGLDTRITTATNTANSAKSAVDNLQVGATNLAIGSKGFAFASQASKANRYVGFPYLAQTFRTRSDGFVETVARSNWKGISVYANALNLAVGDTVTLSVDVRSDASVGNTLSFYAMAFDSSGTRLFGNILGMETRTGSKEENYIPIYPSGTFSPGAHDRVWVKITWLQRAQDIVDAGGRIALTIQATAATSSSNTNVSFWAVKLEHGNTPTSWSPAPEDMATDAALQAEVTERQTLIRQFSGGVLAGYAGNAIAALVNAAGSFDVVRTAWSGGVPSILGTLSTFGANLIRIGEETGQNIIITSAGQLFRYGLNNLLAIVTNGIAIYDGAGNAAENILALITSNLVRIGGRFATSGQSSAGVQFFADDSSTSDLTASHYIDTDQDMQVYHNLMLDGTTTDQMLTGGTVTHSASGNLATYQEVYNDGTNWSEESDTGITAKTGDARQIAKMGVNAMRSSAGIQTRRAYIQADTLRFIHGTGGQTVVSDISMAQAIAGSRQPSVTYTGDNTTFTANANGWNISWMDNTVGGSRADDYFTFSDGVITALRDCLLEISGVAYWNSGPVGQYGFGLFVGSSTVESGTEKSVFNYKASAGGQFSVTMPPVNIEMTTGMKIAVGRYSMVGSVYRNGYNFSWVTIKVIEDRSG